MSIAAHNDMIRRANDEIDAIRAAGHRAIGRVMSQGVEIEIIRKGWRGPERSYFIIPYKDIK